MRPWAEPAESDLAPPLVSDRLSEPARKSQQKSRELPSQECGEPMVEWGIVSCFSQLERLTNELALRRRVAIMKQVSQCPFGPTVYAPRYLPCVLALACSSPDDAHPGATSTDTASLSSNSTTSGVGGAGTTGSMVATGTANSSSSAAGGAVATVTASTTGTTTTTTGAGGVTTVTGAASTTGSTGVPIGELTLSAIAGNESIGLEWPTIAGASGYNLYWSTNPGVTPTTGTAVSGAPRGFVHRGLENGQAYYYVVTALLPEGESAPSPEATATPAGEWVLEQLGTGDFDDVMSGAPVATVPVEQRVHILLFGEGYTADDLAVFHDIDDHSSARRNDVDAWIDLVFGIEPYSLFPEAFVVWYLPRASATTIRDANPDTAFQVPLTLSGSLPQMASPPAGGPTAQAMFEAIRQHPFAPSATQGTLRNFVASFLIFDPDRGQASVSGLTTTLSDPDNGSVRINTAFGLGHAHEFTHAFSGLRDEYLENDNTAPNNWDETSNVVGTNACSELPWAHLLPGGTINADTDGFIGAFGVPSIGYHSELLCLLNGTHDNGEYYASDGSSCQASSCTLRVEDRMCNFCREISAYRIFARSGVLSNDTAGFDSWKAEFRTPFYERFGLLVPGVDYDGLLPQSNDVRNPSAGQQIFEACVP